MRKWRQNPKNLAREREQARRHYRGRVGFTDAQQYERTSEELRVPLIQVARMIKEGVWELNTDGSYLYELAPNVYTSSKAEFDRRAS